MRVGKNISNGLLNGNDVLKISFRDLKGELVLKSHDELNGVKGVETQIVDEVALLVDLGGVDLVELRDDLDHSVLDLREGQTSRGSAVPPGRSCGGNLETIKVSSHRQETSKSSK